MYGQTLDMKRGITGVYVYIFTADSSGKSSMREKYLVAYGTFWIDRVAEGSRLIEDEVPPCKP